jgi:hypothetical protein
MQFPFKFQSAALNSGARGLKWILKKLDRIGEHELDKDKWLDVVGMILYQLLTVTAIFIQHRTYTASLIYCTAVARW